LAPIGLAGSQLARDMRKSPDGLITAIQDLHDHLQQVNPVQQAQILSEAFGGGRSSSAIMTLVQHTGELRDLYGQINDKANEFPKDYYATQQTAAYKLHQAWSSIQADLITLGHDIAPVIAQIAQGAATLLHLFTMLPGHIKTLVFEMGLMAWPILKAAGGIEALAVRWGLVTEQQAVATESASAYSGVMGEVVVEEEAQAAALRDLVVLLNEMNVSAEAFVATMTEAQIVMDATGALGGGEAMAGTLARRRFGSAAGALGIGAAGVIGSQMLGGAVGGGAGHAISTIGTGAAAGAALGSFIPGLGTLTGAGVGALAGGVVELISSVHAAETPVHRFNRTIGDAHAAMRAAAAAQGRWTKANQDFTPTQNHLNHLISQGKAGTQEAAHAAQHYLDIVTGRAQAAKQFHDEIGKLSDKTSQAEQNARALLVQYQHAQRLQHQLDTGNIPNVRGARVDPRAGMQAEIDRAPSRSDVLQALGNARALRDSIQRDLQAHKIRAPLTVDQGQLLNQFDQAMHRLHVGKRDETKIHLFLQKLPPADVAEATKALHEEIKHHQKDAVVKIISDGNPAVVQAAQLAQKVQKITGDAGTKSGKALTDNMNQSLKPGMHSLNTFINQALAQVNAKLNLEAQQAGSSDRITLNVTGGGGTPQGKMAGGLLDGLPTGDNIPLLAQGGEYIVNAQATKKHLPLLQAINNEVPEFAAGGAVGAFPSMAKGFGSDIEKWAQMWAAKHLHGQYVFPFKNVHGFSWGRSDMGLDSTGAGPIIAMGDGSIASTGAPGWPGGGGWVLQLKGGAPRGAPSPKSDTIYQFEHLNARVHAGQTVRAGQVLGEQIEGFPFQETGWSHSGTGTPLAASTYSEGDQTAPGVSMTKWLHTLASHKHQRGGPIGYQGGGFVGTVRRKGREFESTAYGPPWGGIQGEGTTATGINLHDSPHKYIIAVDPSVIPLHSRMSIWPNPFGYQGTFAAEDTGGAIQGNRIDFYDWKGRGHQDAWGRRSVRAMRGAVAGGGGPSGSASLGHHGRGHDLTRQQANELGIPNYLYNKVVAIQSNVQASSELADRIDQLGSPINGHTEVEELHNELDYLLQLRNLLINIYKSVFKAKGKHARELNHINNEIKNMERHKPQAPGHQRIPTGKGVTNAQKNKVNQANQQAEATYHQRTKAWTNKLAKLKKEQSTLSQLTGGTGTDSASGATTAVKQLLDQTQGTQFGTDDPLGFKVLKTLPPVGVLGGDIFNVQMKLRDLDASTSATDQNSDEVSALQSELLATQQRLLVANAQNPILAGLPDIIGQAAGNPFLGGFAQGGVIPGSGVALVGENGPELIDFNGGGARVKPSGASGAAGSRVHVTLEDNRTAIHVDDELVREIFHDEMSDQISKARRTRG
jgi:3D (Asp-Asp-Asp) domain-containing protein